MQRSLALLVLALVGLVLAGQHHPSSDSHRHHHQKRSNEVAEGEDQRYGGSYLRPADFAPQYRQQKEYLYQYDAQLSTGLTGQSQNAVHRMRAQLRLTFTGDKTATVQLKQWQAARLNEEIHQAVSTMMSMESLRTTEIPKRHLDMLEKPFEISYDQGKITELVFDKQDQPWSENVKRAAINALQLQMVDVSDERDSMSFRRNETTIEGSCESLYSVIPEIKCNAVKSSTEPRYLETKDKGQCVQVTKSINFDMCTQRPDLRYNHYRGEQLDSTQTSELKEQRALDQSTITQVELKKDDGKYLVRFARSISHQTVHLTEKSAMMAIQIGELHLKTIKKPTQNAAEVEQRKSGQSLMHSLLFDEMHEQFMGQGKEEFIKQQPYLTERNIPDVLVAIGKRMSKNFVVDSQDEGRIDSDSIAHQFTNFVKILRHATQQDLDKVEERLFRTESEITSAQQKTTLKRLYIDALALASTHPTIHQLFAKIEQKDFMVEEAQAAAALQKVARNAPMVGQEVLRSVWQQCDKAEKMSNLQHACVLAYARMANTMCGRNVVAEEGKKIGDEWALMDKYRVEKDGVKQERCSHAFKQELAKNVQSIYDLSNEDTDQRILAMKAYGNMGLDITVHKIQELIEARTAPRLERIVAVDALRNLATVIPHKVRRTLMNIFIDKREFPEIRQNALHIILRTQPDKATIDQIATVTLREANINVRSFVISELRNAARTMEKINKKTAQQMRATVQLFKLSSAEQIEQMRRSSSRFASVPFADHLVNMATIFSNDSSIPKELMIQMDAAFRNHFIPAYMQLGMHQQNVEQIVGKLFDRIGSRSVDEILVRGKRSTMQNLYSDPVQTMKQMFEQLRIVARRSSDAPSQLMFYRREKQFDTWFVVVDQKHMPETLKQFLSDGELDMSALETQGTHQLNSIDANFVFETKVKVPTIFGVPMVHTARMTKVSAMYGSITTELGGNGKYVSSGRISMKTTPKVSMKVIQKLEAFSPLFTAGVQLQHNLDGQVPITLEASFSARDGLIVDVKLPERKDQVYKLIQFASHPSTLYRTWPEKSRVYVEHEERTLYAPQLKSSYVTIDRQAHCPLSQMEVELRGHYHPGVEGLFLGENALELHAHVNEKTAKVLRFQLRYGVKHPTGEPLQMQRLMRVFENEKRSKQLFQGSAKPEEVKMLQEYVQRHNAHAGSLYELDAKVMALSKVSDKQPKAQLEVIMKTMCDGDMKACSMDAHAEVKIAQSRDTDQEWSAHMIGNVARPTLTGLHGSMRSQHVLSHVEAQFGTKADKNTLTLCTYGRPSELSIAHWNELVNMRSTARASQSERYTSMEDEEYDRMVMTQMPSSLQANKYTFLLEHQLNEKTMKIVSPYLQYAKMAGKTPLQVLFNEAQEVTEEAEDFTTRRHSVLRAEITVESGLMRLQMNDVTRFQRMPNWSSGYGLGMFADKHHNQEQDEHSSYFMSSSQQQSGEQGQQEDSELSSRHSYGQRQAIQKFGARSSSSQQNNVKCILDRSFNVESFDGKKYKIPMSTCYTVLAKDCGSSSAPKFAILAKKQTESRADLKIKLLVPKKQFALFERNSKMVIEMNGEELKQDKWEENGIHKIDETRRPTYVLHCSETGMELRFDGRTTLISITDEYLNKQCGVCGHYNLDAEDTLRKEDNTLASSLKEFHASYLYRGDDQTDEDSKCSQQAQTQFDQMQEDQYYQRSKFSSSSNSNEDDSSDEFNQMEKKNDQMHKHAQTEQANQEEQSNHGKQHRNHQQNNPEEKNSSKGRKHRKNKQQNGEGSRRQASVDSDEQQSSEYGNDKIEPVPMTFFIEEGDVICFSINPVKKCPNGSSAVIQDWWSNDEDRANGQGSEQEFVCMPRHIHQTRKLLRQAREGRVIEELKTMQPNKNLPVPIAKSCSRHSMVSNPNF